MEASFLSSGLMFPFLIVGIWTDFNRMPNNAFPQADVRSYVPPHFRDGRFPSLHLLWILNALRPRREEDNFYGTR
ncbi:hypothetical protein K438DRAFT_1852004 [Mycena galopus ATCC 62051]|nr:hypothetical protein K438DRAFT_1852004 [Mycena galopus ATCC 62051]